MTGSVDSIGIVQLPNCEKAHIAPEKVRDYLLSEFHPIGRYKAAVYRSLGYAEDNWRTLRDDLRNHLIFKAEELESSEYGKKYAVRGSIHGPNGRIADIVSIWIILKDEDFPRFVTAYPE